MVGNFLYVNRGGKRFEEMGLAAGIGYSMDGVARSGMGVDAADVFENGRQALFLADIDQEIFSLYKNNGDKTFDDESWKVGIGPATRMMSGWGLKFFDYDNDGLLDLILSGGHPDDLIDARGRGVTYREPMILFHNEGNEKFLNVSEQGGGGFQETCLRARLGSRRSEQRRLYGRFGRRQRRAPLAPLQQCRKQKQLAGIEVGWHYRQSGRDWGHHQVQRGRKGPQPYEECRWKFYIEP
jgi:hypothetical protein